MIQNIQSSVKMEYNQNLIIEYDQTDEYSNEKEMVVEADEINSDVDYVDEEEAEESFIITPYQCQEGKQKLEKYCEICDKVLLASSFYHHMLRMHNKNEISIFTCDFDGKKFNLKGDLRSHMQTHLPKDSREKFVCSKCDASFLSFSSLKHHENYFHSDYDEIHPCDCGKKFPSRMKLLQHIKTDSAHHNETFKCEKCDRSYRTAASFKKHIKVHNVKKENCNMCDKKLLPGTSMKEHVKTHKLPQFQCKFSSCKKQFFSKSSLNAHLNTHDAESSVECPDCRSIFPTIAHLKKHHTRQHTAIRIECEVPNCNSSYKRKDRLIRHYNKNHDELDLNTREELVNNARCNQLVSW